MATLSEERACELQPLVDKIVARVTKIGGGVTFLEIEAWLEGDIPLHGDHALALPEPYPNIVLWLGMSNEFVEVMQAVQQSHRLDIHPTSPWTYVFDGDHMPDMPLVQGNDHDWRGYTTEHWAPITFSPKQKAES